MCKRAKLHLLLDKSEKVACFGFRHACLRCGRPGPLGDSGPPVKCSMRCCGRYYHATCAAACPLTRWGTGRRTFRCAHHYCCHCGLSGDSVAMVQCNRCPAAYHVRRACRVHDNTAKHSRLLVHNGRHAGAGASLWKRSSCPRSSLFAPGILRRVFLQRRGSSNACTLCFLHSLHTLHLQVKVVCKTPAYRNQLNLCQSFLLSLPCSFHTSCQQLNP